MPDKYEDAIHEEEEQAGGGAAPEHRRCRYHKADGKGCRDWAVRGQEFCYRHGVFLQGRNIDVPLLEDESSIVLVLSETLRAVVCGRIPIGHARMMIDGCRLAHTMQMERLKAAGSSRQRERRCACGEEREKESADRAQDGRGETTLTSVEGDPSSELRAARGKAEARNEEEQAASVKCDRDTAVCSEQVCSEQSRDSEEEAGTEKVVVSARCHLSSLTCNENCEVCTGCIAASSAVDDLCAAP